MICPKPLMGKWQDEMHRRFDLRLERIASGDLRQALVSLERDGVLPPRFAKSIVNLELIRTEEHLTRLTRVLPYHGIWSSFDERTSPTQPRHPLSHSLAVFVCQHSKAAAFLTATPLQTSLMDIVHLMSALGMDVAADPGLLERTAVLGPCG